MPNNKTLAWKFPKEKMVFLRVEIFFLLILAILIFLYTSFQMERQLFLGLVMTVIFLIIYVLVAYGTKKVRPVEDTYKLVKNHLHISRKTQAGVKKEKVPLKTVSHHKLDKLFLGGYMVTVKGVKHVLFFNARDEMEKFEKILVKHLKKPKGKKRKR